MNAFILKRFKVELETTLQDIGTVDNIVISSLDGIAITHASKDPLSVDSIAAKSASFLSLGDIWEDDAGKISCENVIMESKTGAVVVRHMGPKMLLCMTSKNKATTGLMLHHAKSCAQRLIDMTQSIIEQHADENSLSEPTKFEMPKTANL